MLRSGDASPEIRRFAARALLPLDPEDQLRALLAVLDDADAEIAGEASATLGASPPEDLMRFVNDGEPTGVEIDAIARHVEDALVLERLIRHRNVSDETLERLARTVAGPAQEALVVNQARLLRQPSLIDSLFENPELTAESRRRLNEIREEFFEKEARRRESEAARRREEEETRLATEAAAEAEGEGGGEAAAAAEAEEPLESGALFHRISRMTVSEKVQLAYSGGKEERRILIGDSNKLVGLAVLKSRGLTANEVESFCAMRHLDAEIFRRIGLNREWIRRAGVIQALVKNPAVPLAIALPLVKHLQLRDVKLVARDPNLAEGLRVTAKRILEEKRR